LHDRLGVDAWLDGRVTGQEYAKLESYPDYTDQSSRRDSWFARRDVPAYGIVLDAHGKIAWGRADIDNDPIVVVPRSSIGSDERKCLRVDGECHCASTGAPETEHQSLT
jgi:hypothetical protein